MFDESDRSLSVVSTFYVHEGNQSVVEARVPASFLSVVSFVFDQAGGGARSRTGE